jgi:hypothetical protein
VCQYQIHLPFFIEQEEDSNMSNVTLISGAQGPFTNRVGNYGRNAGANLKTYFAAPAAPQAETPSSQPKSPFGDLFGGGDLMSKLPDLMKLVQNLMNPGGSDPKEMMKSIMSLFGGKFGAPKETPDVQFIAPNNLAGGGKVDDALGYAFELLNAKVGEGTGNSPFPSLPKLDGDALKNEKEKMKGMIDMIGGLFGEDMKNQLKEMMDQMDGDPSKMFDQLKDQMGMDVGDFLPGGGKSAKLSLDDSIVDRNGDGKVDLAEKAAEAIFMDDSVNRLKSNIAEKFADPMFEVENVVEAASFRTLQGTLQNESSTEDGIITTNERKWAIAAGDQKPSAGLIGEILDSIIVRENLRDRAIEFEASDLA